jgi:ABC-type antimicrobial peptide transport system permease subunit
VALAGGLLGCLLAAAAMALLVRVPGMGLFFVGMTVTTPIVILSIVIAGIVGFLSAVFPAYHAAKVNIVDGLRHIG